MAGGGEAPALDRREMFAHAIDLGNIGARAQQRYGRRSPFVPLDHPEFVTAGQASYLSDDELVLGLYAEGEARAYPVRMVFYHHIVNDLVGGSPILVTY